MKKDEEKNVLDLRKEVKKNKTPLEKKAKKKVAQKEEKPEKRMRSIWVVLITALLTALAVGGGFTGYLYWEANFKNSEDRAEIMDEQKIEGKNIVIVTSDNEKLFVNFYNPETGAQITQELDIDSTIQGGSWAKKNKNQLVQFDEAGNYFYVLEVKEPSLSDEAEYAKIVKYSRDGSEEEVILESENYLAYSNYLYENGKIYYLASSLDDNGDISKWDLMSLNLEDKKSKVLSEDVGEYFEKEISLRDNKIESLYKKGSYIYKVSYDLVSGEMDNQYLFRASYSTTYQLSVEDVFISPYENKYVFKDHSSWEGYSLKIFDEETRGSKILIKNENISFSEVKWFSKTEIVFVKTPVFIGLEEESSNQLIKININKPEIEGIYLKSEELLKPIIITEGYQLYFEGERLIYKEGEEEKELTLMSLTSISDILFVACFNYDVDSED